MVAGFKVADAGLMIVNATQGVEVGTEIFARYAEQYKMPLIIGVNQLDSEKAGWDTTIDSLKQTFGNKVVPVQFPVAVGPGFDGFVDVLKQKFYRFKDENGTREDLEIPAEYADQAEEYRLALMEAAAQNDEELMDKYFETNDLTFPEMIKGLNLGILSGSVMPVFCLSARKDIGVKRLMEFVINATPSPVKDVEVTTEGVEVPCDASKETALFFYRTSVEQHLGEVSYFKVMSGKITEGMDLVNPVTGAKERVTQIYAVAGKKKEKVSEMVAGDLGCTVKLKTVKTNQTLCVPSVDWAFKAIEFPQSKFRTAIKAKDEKDEEKLGEALNKYAAEDPTIEVLYAKELKQTILSGQGEHHINILKWHLNNVYKLEVDLFAPRISYRETITKVATASYRHKKQSGGAGQFGEVHLLIEPFV